MVDLILKVRCPFCGWEQLTSSVISARCIRCQKSFSIFPKTEPSRVVAIVKGDMGLLYRKRMEAKEGGANGTNKR